MRSYADTLNGGSSKGSTNAACCKFMAVIFALGLIAGAVFLGVKIIKDEPSSSENGAPGSSSSSSSQGKVYSPSKPPDDPTASSPPAAGQPTLAPSFMKLRDPPIVKQEVMDFRYGDMLGDTFMFLETQHSGDLSLIPGGNRIKWRGDQLLQDGSDVGLNLTGGIYEAGNRLKILMPTSYMVSHLAWLCYYYSEMYKQVEYDGKPLLHWCKREVKWVTDWMLKLHVYKGATRPSKWDSKHDKLVIMVGNLGDFNCYQRAELIPDKQDCLISTRQTQFANATHPAAEVAFAASAAFAASSVLFQADDQEYSVELMRSAYALFDFGLKHNASASTWNADVKKTYNAGSGGQFLLWAAAMIAWAHKCEEDLPLCNQEKARAWMRIAEEQWVYQVADFPERHATHMISNWASPDYDSALVLTAMVGNVSNPYATHVREYIKEYATAATQIKPTPKGLVRHASEDWSALRLAYQSAFTAAQFASYPGVDAATVKQARCFARSQMGYVAGDNPHKMSYVTGFGQKWPQQVHHRDSACTLLEGVEGKCVTKTKQEFYNLDRANPLTVIGAVVGGPDTEDKFVDKRDQYHYTEVALDYNVGLASGLTSIFVFPADFWTTDCSQEVKYYKWAAYPAKGSPMTTSARQRGEDPNAGLDISPAVASSAGIAADPDGDWSNAEKPDKELL